MCFSADWKREVVPEHKFDFVDVREYRQTTFWMRCRYVLVYVWLLKSLAVYGLDIFTAVTMLSTDHWTNAIQAKCQDAASDCVVSIPFNVAKWIFVGCIGASFLLLAYESWKARRIVRSRDISYAFTNPMAQDYYSLKSYDTFCFFAAISRSTKTHDDFAFFIFFTFKSWKALLFADGPRQAINGLILFSFAKANHFQTSNLSVYWEDSVITLLLLLAMLATLVIFVGSAILLLVAAVCYVPLLCYIQGNLKEYVCHKVDKRIAHLVRKKGDERSRRAVEMEKKRAAGIGGKQGQQLARGPQPTLPKIAFDDDKEFAMGGGVGGYPPLVKSQSDRSLGAWSDSGVVAAASRPYYEQDLPPGALGFNAPPPPPPPQNAFYATDQYGSSAHLVDAAAPFGTVAYPTNTYSEPYPAPAHNQGYYGQPPLTSSYGAIQRYSPEPYQTHSHQTSLDSSHHSQSHLRPYSPAAHGLVPSSHSMRSFDGASSQDHLVTPYTHHEAPPYSYDHRQQHSPGRAYDGSDVVDDYFEYDRRR